MSGDVATDPGQGDEGRGGLADELIQVVIGLADLGGQVLVAAREAAQGQLGGLLGVLEVSTGAELGAGGDQRWRAQVPQLLAKLLGTCDQQRLDLIRGLAARLDCARAGDAQSADRLDLTVATLRRGGRGPGQSGSGRGVGVEGVGLAVGPSCSPVGPVDLDDDHVCGAETAGQGGAVGSGALDADTIKVAEAS